MFPSSSSILVKNVNLSYKKKKKGKITSENESSSILVVSLDEKKKKEEEKNKCVTCYQTSQRRYELFVMSHANGRADSDHVHPLTVNKSLKDIIVGVGGDIKKRTWP